MVTESRPRSQDGRLKSNERECPRNMHTKYDQKLEVLKFADKQTDRKADKPKD